MSGHSILNAGSNSLSESDVASIRYISLPEHAQFMESLETQLQLIASEDSVLKESIVPLLSCCPKNNTNNRQLRFNNQVAAYLQSKVDHYHGRALQLTVHFLDGQTTTEAFVRSTDSLKELKSSVERSIELRVRMNNNHRHINWAHVWRRYDLWIDRRQRIQMKSEPVSSCKPERDIGLDHGTISQTIIVNHSQVEFIHCRSVS